VRSAATAALAAVVSSRGLPSLLRRATTATTEAGEEGAEAFWPCRLPGGPSSGAPKPVSACPDFGRETGLPTFAGSLPSPLALAPPSPPPPSSSSMLPCASDEKVSAVALTAEDGRLEFQTLIPRSCIFLAGWSGKGDGRGESSLDDELVMLSSSKACKLS